MIAFEEAEAPLWEVWNMGGGTRAYGVGGDRFFVLVTALGGVRLPEEDEPVLLGLYESEGAEEGVLLLELPSFAAAEKAIVGWDLDG